MFKSRLVVKEHVISEQQQMSAPFYGSMTYATNYSYQCTDEVVVVGGNTYCDQLLYWSDSSVTNDSGSSGPSSSNSSIASVTAYGGYFGVNAHSPGDAVLSGYSSNVPLDSSGSNYGTLYAQTGVTACNFTISPSSFSGVDCTGQTQNHKGFSANISPSAWQCLLNETNFQCSAVRESGNIDMDETTCHIVENASATGIANFFAGPPLSPPNDHIAGTIKTSFTLRLGVQMLTRTSAAMEAVCQQ